MTIISLVIGIITLGRVLGEWDQKHAAVNELMGAATWLQKSEHYLQAWDMYQQALALAPGNADARRAQRQLAMVWLREFDAPKDAADPLLMDLTSVLYRGLSNAGANEASTILAHVAWAQMLRQKRELPVFVNVDALFEEALKANPTNVFANAMLAYRMLTPRGIAPQDVDAAMKRYGIALSSGLQKPLVRRLEFASLDPHSFAASDEEERAALAALLHVCLDMMHQKEPRPSPTTRYRILNTYGRLGRAEHVEASVDFLPPKQHLAVRGWLLQGLDYSEYPRMMAQSHYIDARLAEASGNHERALAGYRSLLEATDSTEPLNNLVDAGIKRLTGELPARALARHYSNDPLGDADPLAFHLETLRHFDPLTRPPNFDQALEFIREATARHGEHLPRIAAEMQETIERVHDVVREGDTRKRLGSYTAGYTSFSHDLARGNLVDLNIAYARTQAALRHYDKAIAAIEDMRTFTADLDEHWALVRAEIAFELARAHSLRAAANDDDADRTEAVRQLRLAIEAGAVDDALVTWEEIKGKDFSSLHGLAEYRAIIRGR